jgi:hypothetical protein
MIEDFTYKFFDIPNLEAIQNKFWDKIPLEYKSQQTYIEIDTDRIGNFIPLIEAVNLFHNWDDVYKVAIIIVQPYSHHQIHKDIGPFIETTKFVFNIPIKNFEDTYTFFFKLKEERNPKFDIKWKDVDMMTYERSDVDEIDKFVCNRPCFFNTQIPHKVQNFGDTIRALISIRFKTPFNFEKIFNSK